MASRLFIYQHRHLYGSIVYYCYLVHGAGLYARIPHIIAPHQPVHAPEPRPQLKVIREQAPVPAYQALTERSILNKPLAGKNAQVFLLDDNAAAAGALSLVTRPLLIDQENIIGLHIDAKIDEVEIAALRASNVQFKIMNATDIVGPCKSSAW